MLRNTNQSAPGLNEPAIRPTRTQEGIEGLTVQDRELSTLTELDPQSLDKAFSYRWVYRSPLKVARMRARGYITVDPADDDQIKIAGVGSQPEVASDGTYTVGDVMLMKIPKSQFNARTKKKKRKTDVRLKGPTRQFKKKAKEQGSIKGQEIEVIRQKDPEKEED